MERRKKSTPLFSGLFCPFYDLSPKYAILSRTGWVARLLGVVWWLLYTELIHGSKVMDTSGLYYGGKEKWCWCFILLVCLATLLFTSSRKQYFKKFTDFLMFDFLSCCFVLKEEIEKKTCIMKLSFWEVNFHMARFWPLPFCSFLAGNWLEAVWSWSRNWGLLFGGIMQFQVRELTFKHVVLLCWPYSYFAHFFSETNLVLMLETSNDKVVHL